MRVIVAFLIAAAVFAAPSLQAQWQSPNPPGDVTHTDDKVGIGTTVPAAKLHVEDPSNDVELLVAAGDEPGSPNGPTLTLMRRDGNDMPLARWAMRLDADDADKLKMMTAGTGAFSPAIFTLTRDAKFGIGTTVPSARLHVEDQFNDVELLVAAGDEPGDPNSPTLTLMRRDGNNAPLTKWGLRLDAVDGDKLKMMVGGGGDFFGTIFTATSDGSFGLGTTTPGARLHVDNSGGSAESIVSAGGASGTPTLTLMRKNASNAQVAKFGLTVGTDDRLQVRTATTGGYGNPVMTVDGAGNLTVTGAITGARVLNAVYQDVAEWVPATEDLTPGTVVILNPGRTNEVMRSAGAYDARVAGVVSEQPGVLLGVGSPSKEMIATTGRVRVKVDARPAAIAVGDLLVTSDERGMAMKSEPLEIQGRRFHQPGTIIGKALEPLSGGVGEILVLLSLQ